MIDIRKHKWKLFIIVSAIGLFLDWFTKYIAATKLTPYRAVSVLGEVLQFQLTFNRGFLFGFDPRQYFPGFPVTVTFIIFSILAMTLLIVYYINIDPKAQLPYWAISIIMPGALGNLFDRIIRPGQGVVDFIKFDINIPPFDPWPIFNMADAYITIGVALVAFDMLFLEGKRREQEKVVAEKVADSPGEVDNAQPVVEVDDAPTVVE
jgi:signal peptidase II